MARRAPTLVAAVAAALALVLALLLWLQLEPPPAAGAVPAAVPGEEGGAADALPLDPGPAPSEASVAPLSAQEAGATERRLARTEEAADEERRAEPVLLTGRVQVLDLVQHRAAPSTGEAADADGAGHPVPTVRPEDLHGNVRLRSGAEPGGATAEAPIVGGRFEVHLPRGTQVVVEELRLQGRDVVLPQPVREWPTEGDLVLPWVKLPSVEFRLLDEQTGAHLARFDLFELPVRSLPSRKRHPDQRAGEERFVVRDAASPYFREQDLAFGIFGGSTLWAAAEGYAVEQLEGSYPSTDLVIERLSPAAGLVVQFTGDVAREGLAVRLHGDGYEFEEPVDGAQPLRWHRLPAGPVRLQLFEAAIHEDLGASVETDLVAHETALVQVEIPPRSAGPVRPSAVIVRVTVPESWNLDRLVLVLGRRPAVGPLHFPLPGAGPRLAEARFEGPFLGTESLQIHPLQFWTELALEGTTSGEWTVDLVPPELGSLDLLGVDAATGAEVRSFSAQWATECHGRLWSGRWVPRGKVVVPAGRLELTVNSNGYASAELEALSAVGAAPLRVPLAPR
jgi:hypothetical protein